MSDAGSYEQRPRSSRKFLTAAASAGSLATVDLDGVTYLVSPSDDGVGRDLFVEGGRPEFAVLARALGVLGEVRGDLLDVGANIGTTTLPATVRHGFARAVSCEPGAESARLLRANCALNGVQDRVTVVEAAISDEPGETLLDVSSDPGTFRIARAGAPETRVVAQTTVDQLIVDGVVDPSRVALFWIDAIGHEAQVLAGAAGLLERRPPTAVAVRSRYLRKTGHADGFVARVKASFTRFVDLRVPIGSPWEARPQPIGEVDRVLESLRTTDLLLLAD